MFIQSQKYFEDEAEEELLKRLIYQIEIIHEKQISEPKICIEEAKGLAVDYINMLVDKKKQNALKFAQHQAQSQKPTEEDLEHNSFIKTKKQMGKYDRLVKELFKMIKKKVFRIQNLATDMQKDAMRQPRVFSNFVFIKNRNNLEIIQDNVAHEKIKMIHEFQGLCQRRIRKAQPKHEDTTNLIKDEKTKLVKLNSDSTVYDQ
ncbi:UNKNOWN [Stylonychia lemnae]|uniref:Uncharacterized protein n=1 Tax=Stylonychia lemnae TaxID=5949 RepID=A0A078BCH4_STYLE|nr:UNKNOWN [Stylonychia lemnae]|eukprot:CDW90907.1 UNKNOWN [Stylonychia lemnae]